MINSSNIIFSILRKPIGELEAENLNSYFETKDFGYESKNDQFDFVILCHGYTAIESLKNSRYLIENKCKIIILTDLKFNLNLNLQNKRIIIWSESLIGSGFHSFYQKHFQNKGYDMKIYTLAKL